jgi:hypothetical protein
MLRTFRKSLRPLVVGTGEEAEVATVFGFSGLTDGKSGCRDGRPLNNGLRIVSARLRGSKTS